MVPLASRSILLLCSLIVFLRGRDSFLLRSGHPWPKGGNTFHDRVLALESCSFPETVFKDCNQDIFKAINIVNRLADEIGFRWYMAGGNTLNAARFGTFTLPFDLYRRWQPRYMEKMDDHMHTRNTNTLDIDDYDPDQDAEAYLVFRTKEDWHKMLEQFLAITGFGAEYRVSREPHTVKISFFACPKVDQLQEVFERKGVLYGAFWFVQCHIDSWYREFLLEKVLKRVLRFCGYSSKYKEIDDPPCFARTSFELSPSFECGECIWSPYVDAKVGIGPDVCYPLSELETGNGVDVLNLHGYPVPVFKNFWGNTRIAWRGEYGSTCDAIAFPQMIPHVPIAKGLGGAEKALKIMDICETKLQARLEAAIRAPGGPYWNSKKKGSPIVVPFSSHDKCEQGIPFALSPRRGPGILKEVQAKCPYLFDG